jgi:hypothetical protein
MFLGLAIIAFGLVEVFRQRKVKMRYVLLLLAAALLGITYLVINQ